MISDKTIKDMWIKFGEIPINDNDEIDLDFYGWKKGTSRFDIWHWFDAMYSRGLYKLFSEAYN